MKIPDDLMYHPEHTWARKDGGEAVVGITDFAQSELGDVVFVDLPEKGRILDIGTIFGSVESSKSISELYSPVSGEVVEVNSDLEDSPEKVNDDPYGEGWMIKVKISGKPFGEGLIDKASYESLLNSAQSEK